MLGITHSAYGNKRRPVIPRRTADLLSRMTGAMAFYMLIASVILAFAFLICAAVGSLTPGTITAEATLTVLIAAGITLAVAFLSWIASRQLERHQNYWHEEIVGEPLRVVETIETEHVLAGLSNLTGQRITSPVTYQLVEGFNRTGTYARGMQF